MQTESKKNPSKIPLVLLRYNHNQKKIKRKSKNGSVKRLRCICDNPWAFFDLSSVAAGLQSAMQQYYLPTIYFIWRWTGISLAIIRSVSLRPQNEGQKKRSRIALMHTESLTRIFWPFLFFRCKGILNGFASVTACGCWENEEWRMKNEESTFGGRRESQLYNLEILVNSLTRLLLKKNFFFFFCPHTLTIRLKRPVYRGFKGEGKGEGKLSPLTLALTPKSVWNPSCPVKAQSISKENQNINQKEKIKKRIREKTPW